MSNAKRKSRTSQRRPAPDRAGRLADIVRLFTSILMLVMELARFLDRV